MRWVNVLMVGWLVGVGAAAERAPLQSLVVARTLLRQAEIAFRQGNATNALGLATRSIAAEPALADAWMFRGRIRAGIGWLPEAAGDFTRVIEIEPRNVDAFLQRGLIRMRQDRVVLAIEDFDRVIKLAPEREPSLWPRGLALCLDGRWGDARKQFESCGRVSTNDVELAAWHFLAVAQIDGVEAAQGALFSVTNDFRAPMAEIHGLLAGRNGQLLVAAAAEAGQVKPIERDLRRFYARLYTGLWLAARKENARAIEALALASEGAERFGLIGDVARLYLERLRAGPAIPVAPIAPAERAPVTPPAPAVAPNP